MDGVRHMQAEDNYMGNFVCMTHGWAELTMCPKCGGTWDGMMATKKAEGLTDHISALHAFAMWTFPLILLGVIDTDEAAKHG